jgi:hypothetical protein
MESRRRLLHPAYFRLDWLLGLRFERIAMKRLP